MLAGPPWAEADFDWSHYSVRPTLLCEEAWHPHPRYSEWQRTVMRRSCYFIHQVAPCTCSHRHPFMMWNAPRSRRLLLIFTFHEFLLGIHCIYCVIVRQCQIWFLDLLCVSFSFPRLQFIVCRTINPWVCWKVIKSPVCFCLCRWKHIWISWPTPSYDG